MKNLSIFGMNKNIHFYIAAWFFMRIKFVCTFSLWSIIEKFKVKLNIRLQWSSVLEGHNYYYPII